jgi:hypothetical protein
MLRGGGKKSKRSTKMFEDDNNDEEPKLPGFFAGMLQIGGGGWEADKTRSIICYNGEHYVLLAKDNKGAGVIVMPRAEYAQRKAVSLVFIPAEFIADAYPAVKYSCGDFHNVSFTSFGCAAREDLDTVQADLDIRLHRQGYKHGTDENANAIEAFRKTKYEYPDLGQRGMDFLDLDERFTAVTGVIEAMDQGSDFEDAAATAHKNQERKEKLTFKRRLNKLRENGEDIDHIPEEMQQELDELEDDGPQDDRGMN